MTEDPDATVCPTPQLRAPLCGSLTGPLSGYNSCHYAHSAAALDAKGHENAGCIPRNDVEAGCRIMGSRTLAALAGLSLSRQARTQPSAAQQSAVPVVLLAHGLYVMQDYVTRHLHLYTVHASCSNGYLAPEWPSPWVAVLTSPSTHTGTARR